MTLVMHPDGSTSTIADPSIRSGRRIVTRLRLADGSTVPIELIETADNWLQPITIDGKYALEWEYSHETHIIERVFPYPAQTRKHIKNRMPYKLLLLNDVRLFSKSQHTRTALIEQVIDDCKVSRTNARRILWDARVLYKHLKTAS